MIAELPRMAEDPFDVGDQWQVDIGISIRQTHSCTTKGVSVAKEFSDSPNESVAQTPINIQEIENFLETIYFLNELSDVRAAIDVLFDYFNKQIRDRRYDVCNYVLTKIDFSRISSTLIVAVLSITLPVKQELWARILFFRRAHSALVAARGMDPTNRLLNKYS